MGKVRTEMIKRISKELLNRYPKSFTIQFEENKQFLKEIGLDTSKKLRNKLAGYITTLVNRYGTRAIRRNSILIFLFP